MIGVGAPAADFELRPRVKTREVEINAVSNIPDLSQNDKDFADSGIVASVFAAPVSNVTAQQGVTWSGLCRRLINSPIVLPDNRAETKATYGQYLTRGPIEGSRSDKNLKDCHLLFLDVDKGLAGAPIPSPVKIHDVLDRLKLQHAVHRTATPDRCRIVLRVAPYNKEDSGRLTRSAYQLCQEHGLLFEFAGESKTKSQPMFLPQTTDPANHQAFCRVDGDLFTPALCSTGAPPLKPAIRKDYGSEPEPFLPEPARHNPTRDFLEALEESTVHEAARSYAGWRHLTSNLTAAQIFDEITALVDAVCADRSKIDRWHGGERASMERWFRNNAPHEASGTDRIEGLVVHSGSAFLKQDYPAILPLVGTADNAFLVPGEGAFIIATGGTGKTTLATDLALKMSLGLPVLGYPVSRPLRVLFLQAELPQAYFQKQLRQQTNGYRLVYGEGIDDAVERVHIAALDQIPDLGTKAGRDILGDAVLMAGADVVVIDPYLSFFPSVDENNNGLVRAALDALKHEVLIPLACAAIITDHQSKAAGATPGQEHHARGAGAKRDWAATSIGLKKAKTPAGEHGAFLDASVDKLRYGPTPRAPFLLKRDSFTGSFEVVDAADIPLYRVAEVLDDIDGDVTQKIFTGVLGNSLMISHQEARRLIAAAIEGQWVVVTTGRRNAQLHKTGPEFERWMRT